jgi:hypothetical protein
MYPEIAIKASFPKVSSHNIKIANKVRSVFDKHIFAKNEAMSIGVLSDPSLIG